MHGIVALTSARTPVRTPVVTIAITVLRMSPGVIDIHGVVDGDTRPAIVVAVVMMTVIRVAPVTCMMYTQMIAGPANTERCRHAPEVAGRKRMTVRIRVVINRVRLCVVVVYGTRLLNDHYLWLVVGHINNVVLDRYDLDDVIIFADGLILIGFQIAGNISPVAKYLDCRNDTFLLADDGLAKPPGPVDIVIQQCDDFRIIDQRDHRLVPVLIRFERAVDFVRLQKSRSLHDLQRIGGRRQYDGQQVIGIQGNGTDQRLQVIGCQLRVVERLNRIVAAVRGCLSLYGHADKQHQQCH